MKKLLFSSHSHLVLIFFLGSLFEACTTAPVQSSGAVHLRLQADGPRVELAEVSLDSETEFFENEEMSHRSVRALKIKVQSEIIPLPDDPKSMWIKNTTVERDGNQ